MENSYIHKLKIFLRYNLIYFLPNVVLFLQNYFVNFLSWLNYIRSVFPDQAIRVYANFSTYISFQLLLQKRDNSFQPDLSIDLTKSLIVDDSLKEVNC